MSKGLLRLDGLICLVVLIGAPIMALVSLIDGDSQEAIYWGGGGLATLAYSWMLLKSWGDEE